jgi:hypothetical protein
MDELNNKCAPSKNYTDGSCFTLESLKNIANKYNEINEDKIIINDDKSMMVKQLENKLSNECSTQTCWLKLDIVKELKNEEINVNTFRPIGPKGKYEWLSTTHINDVVSQYHNKYPEFLFLGAVPYDFEDLPILGISTINFDNLKSKNKTKIGMVINLDEHYKNGSHWVALYTDLIKKQIYFFDSYGKKPNKRIRKFVNKIVNYLYNSNENKNISIGSLLKYINKIENIKKKKKYMNLLANKLNNYDIRYNKIRHQFDNSECGVYSMNFILRLVKGETFDYITNNITLDDDMNECRNTYFRKN